MDVPTEILMIIFRQLMIEGHDTLFSCILVNSTWCKIAIPYLWRRPFSWIRRPLSVKKGTRFLRILDVMYHFLRDEEKKRLTLDGYLPVNELRNTLFPYPSYIREITNVGLYFSLDFWQRTYTFGDMSETKYSMSWYELSILVNRTIVRKDVVLFFCRMLKQESRIHRVNLFMNPVLDHDIRECMKCFPCLKYVKICAHSQVLSSTSWVSLIPSHIRELKLFAGGYPQSYNVVIFAKILCLYNLETIHLNSHNHNHLHVILDALHKCKERDRHIRKICLHYVSNMYDCCMESILRLKPLQLKWRHSTRFESICTKLFDRCKNNWTYCRKIEGNKASGKHKYIVRN